MAVTGASRVAVRVLRAGRKMIGKKKGAQNDSRKMGGGFIMIAAGFIMIAASVIMIAAAITSTITVFPETITHYHVYHENGIFIC